MLQIFLSQISLGAKGMMVESQQQVQFMAKIYQLIYLVCICQGLLQEISELHHCCLG